MDAKNGEAEKIIVKGARTHNLKNVTVEMPRNKMIVFTGLSGSGKSSLAFDTIFAEGQRRYVESLSAYARQFLRQMQKPDVDEIVGLSPAISIDQKSRSGNPRSTVATVTEIYDYLRVLFARLGRPHCLLCNREIRRLSPEEIMETILSAVRAAGRGGNVKEIYGVSVGGPRLKIYAPLVLGRKGEYYQLLYDLLGKGYAKVRIDGVEKKLREQIILSKNKRHDIEVLIDELNASDLGGSGHTSARERLTEAVERALHESDGLIRVETAGESRLISAKFMCPYDGFSYPEIEPRLFSFNSPYGACSRCNGLGTQFLFSENPCPRCQGARLRDEALMVLVAGKNIVEITKMSIAEGAKFFSALSLTAKERGIAKVVMREIESRLKFMLDVGIEYLTLNRRTHTLSGGEAQRIRLASQLGSGLVGALYVLDEPTIGLHPADNSQLIKTLLHLRDIGNTIIVVEHDEETILSSDYLVDIGPGAGESGGHIVVADNLSKLLAAKKNESGSETLKYLRGEKFVPVPAKRREGKGKLAVRGGSIYNIKDMDVDVPLGRMVCLTGVSGSGKSTFLYEILYKNLQARLERRYRTDELFHCASFKGTEYLSRAILIDQSPIGRTPRSNPSTYTGAFTFIRDLFAATAEARVRGWKAGRFSFNVRGGRCEACAGAGEIAVEMHFLPTVYVTCDVCRGRRFMKETLEVKYKRKSIDDVLQMTVKEALGFFKDIPAVSDRLKTLDEVGLSYLTLGQPATTLSGGEAERIKISSELYRPHTQKTIYLLDEPTIGLHYEDVRKLIDILNRLVDKGNTVVIIEHNMDIVKSADYIIDIGPGGGEAGGRVVAKGAPEEVARSKTSRTAEYLGRALS
ncbi:MAG: excinuclease ABC subunit UvrA [Candidatus Taylorbacteria bacterium]|nr:excinuclease ABC subunit UvrA [Candidatus Taylorbacteria bacterium]